MTLRMGLPLAALIFLASCGDQAMSNGTLTQAGAGRRSTRTEDNGKNRQPAPPSTASTPQSGSVSAHVIASPTNIAVGGNSWILAPQYGQAFNNVTAEAVTIKGFS